MTKNLKNIFVSQGIYNIFEKYNWKIYSNTNDNYDFNYKGEIADYYLNISLKSQTIIFEYVLDVEFPKDKIYDLFVLINFINEKSIGGYFTFNLDFNIIKFKVSKNCDGILTKEFILEFIETNLSFTHELFRNFTLYLHNLVHNEKTSQDLMELMFLNIEGHA